MIAKCLLSSLVVSATLYAQGSLTPPGGPAPSMKTLGQIEPRVAIDKLPYKVSAAGAYYLTTNLVVPAGQYGITIDANLVTLDLNDFVITGATDSEAAIAVVSGRADVSIRRGMVMGAGTGIEAPSASRVQVEALRVVGCANSGITVGADSTISHCSVADNLSPGIFAGPGSTVEHCQAVGNGANGIEVGAKSTVRNSSANRNALAGISAGDYSKIIGATAADNSGPGLNGSVGVHFVDCTATANKQQGINAGRLAFVTRANTSGNTQAGVNAGDSASVMDTTSSANGYGIVTGNTAHIANCKVDSNAGPGITVAKGSTVRDCSVQRNSNDGISVTDQCLVLRNNLNGNSNLKGAAGIHVKGTDNSVQENVAVANDRGIALESEGNFVARNSSSNNSINFFNSGDQFIGPVLNTFDGVDVINPQSNFTY